MKRKILRAIALVAVAAALLTLCGCSSIVSGFKEGFEKGFNEAIVKNLNGDSKLIGTWQGEVDLAPAINKGMADSDAEVAQSLQVDEFKLTLVFTFNDDNTYSTGVTEESVAAAKQHLAELFSVTLRAYLEKSLKDAGVDMSVDDALAHSEMTFDDYLNSVLDSIDEDAIAKDIELNGTYDFDGEKLMLSDSTSHVPDPEMYFTVELDGDKLTVTGSSGYDETNDLFAGIYPVEFTKQQ